jgi:SAM-dependent methyltransferase
MNAEQLQLNARVEDRHWWFVGRRQIMQAIVGRLVPPQGDALLIDIGCGTGGNIGALSERYQTVGIDTSPDAIELARERFPRCRFILGRAPKDLGASARQARCFLLMDVLEHVQDDVGLLTELIEAASPGAYFLLTVPANPALWSKHDESHLHYRRYDYERFCALWRHLPVQPLAVSYFNARLYFPVWAVRAFNRWRGGVSGQADTDLWLPTPLVNAALRRLYAGEARRLVALVEGRRGRGFARGVSLLAVLRREMRPARIPPSSPEAREPSPFVLAECT